MGADAIALFSKSSNQWKARPFDDATLTLFNSERAQFPSTPLMTHASYLINLAGTDPVLYEKSIDAMVDELERADMLGAYAVVLHPGAHVGTGVTSATSRFCALL